MAKWPSSGYISLFLIRKACRSDRFFRQTDGQLPAGEAIDVQVKFIGHPGGSRPLEWVKLREVQLFQAIPRHLRARRSRQDWKSAAQELVACTSKHPSATTPCPHRLDLVTKLKALVKIREGLLETLGVEQLLWSAWQERAYRALGGTFLYPRVPGRGRGSLSSSEKV